jgi:hypothetical protein
VIDLPPEGGSVGNAPRSGGASRSGRSDGSADGTGASSRNPILAREVKAKALLAKAAAAGAIRRAAAQPGGVPVMGRMTSLPGGNVDHRGGVPGGGGYDCEEGEEAAQEKGPHLARFMAVDGGGRRVAIQTMPNTRPYFPRRREGGVPGNEQEAGNLAVAQRRKVVVEAGVVCVAGMSKEHRRRRPELVSAFRLPRPASHPPDPLWAYGSPPDPLWAYGSPPDPLWVSRCCLSALTPCRPTFRQYLLEGPSAGDPTARPRRGSSRKGETWITFKKHGTSMDEVATNLHVRSHIHS